MHRAGKTLTVLKAEVDPVWQPLRRCGKVTSEYMVK